MAAPPPTVGRAQLLLLSSCNKQEYEQRTTFTAGKGLLFSAAILGTATDTGIDDIGDDDIESVENLSDDEEELIQGSDNEDLAVTSQFSYLMTKEELESVNTEYIEGDKVGSRWLVIESVHVHILHKYCTESKSEMFFQKNIRSSFLLYWPYARVLGCYFHFTQFVWRKEKKNGFQVINEKDDQFNALIRRMSALPFAPKETLDELMNYYFI